MPPFFCQCVKRSTIKTHMLMLSVQVGQTIASINLILVSEVAVVERRGYLTLSVEAGGVGRNYFRRTSSIR